MFSEYIDNFKKKSLKERFLLVIGILFFLIYLTIGLTIIFWKKLPLNMPDSYRTALGIVMIVYAFLRFLRFFNKDKIQND
jgi:cytochrome c biogenesis protein CcdA